MNEDAVFPIGDPDYDAIYAQEAAMIEASELIAQALETSGISRADLARRLGVSRGEITARLKGERNITVRTLAETLHALDARLSLSIETPEPTHRRRERGWVFPTRPNIPQAKPTTWVHEEASHGH